tara:strand:- start:1462 stop:1722 length:261 start_codon:yes stop_codon:yes gene_type:complete
MWNCPQKPISQADIDAEHMKALEEAVINCEQDFDVRSKQVYIALDYFQARSLHSWGFSLFRQGLEDWSPAALHEGLKLIKQHLGKS